MILQKGTVIANRYEILEQIGAGGMSYVYRALDEKLGRNVTVKVLREEYAADASFVSRFDTEAKAVASLNHANIVSVYDVGSEGDVQYIVMEYVHGKTLKELIEDKAPFRNDIMLGVAEQIALALIHAHENGVVHKDIKPQNILVMPNGAVKVTDFGIADHKNAHKSDDKGSTMGSVHYISPEASCNDPVDARSDLYSLGITMYEMMTGELPFDASDPDEIPAMHREAPFPNIARKNPDTLPMVREIILKLTQKMPYRRHQTANSLYNEIQRAIMESTKYAQFEENEKTSGYREDVEMLTRPKPRTGQPKSRQSAKKDKLFIAGGIATVVVVVAFLGFLAWAFWPSSVPEGYADIPRAVVGRDIVDVRNELEGLGLTLEIREEYHPDRPAGQIIEANVAGPGHWRLDEPIVLVVSLGSGEAEQVEVPNVVEMSLAAAVALFADLPIYLSEEAPEPSDTVAVNAIISQYPPAGTMLNHGESLRITVSLGPQNQLVNVPNLVALTQMAAHAQLVQNNLVLGEITAEASEAHPPGTVIRQNPNPGTQLPRDASVDIVISDPNVPPEETEPAQTTTPPAETTAPGTTPADDDDDYSDNDENGDENGDEQVEVTTPATPQPTSRTITIHLNYFSLPADQVSIVNLYRVVDGINIFEATRMASPGDGPWSVTVSGTGRNIEFIATVNGVNVGSQWVHFE